MKKYHVLDLFAGVGGLSYAFHKSSIFEVVAANELLEKPARAYELNHPNTRMYVGDVREFSREVFEGDFGPNTKIDVILGGPPCQSYSTAGKRNLTDPRATLFEQYYRLLVEFKPKIFVFENVKGLLSMESGKLFKDILRLFSSAGYKTQAKLINAVDFGAPQFRERVIIVGTLPDIQFEYPTPTHAPQDVAHLLQLEPHLTLRDAIGDLPEIRQGERATEYSGGPLNEFQKKMRSNSKILMDHEAPVHGASLNKIINALPEGGSAWDLPHELQPTSGFGNSYGRLWWDQPNPTITRNLGTPSSARCIHPSLPRALTTREGARIQTFPDDFQFYGGRVDKNLQIGEAVPVVLSWALIQSVQTAIDSDAKEEKLSNESDSFKQHEARIGIRKTSEEAYHEAI